MDKRITSFQVEKNHRLSALISWLEQENVLALVCMSLHFFICLIVAFKTDKILFCTAIAAPAISVPAWLAKRYPNAVLTRIVMTAGAMTFTMLGVQQTGGYLEAHFSFFVMITVIGVYRDWRLLIFGSVLIIIHHVAFTVWDPAAIGFYVVGDDQGAWKHVISHISIGLVQVFTMCYITIVSQRRDKINATLGNSLELAKELARRDPLTGLFNRNHLDEVVTRIANRLGNESMEAVVCALDIDHFKRVNDVYGHASGDDVLRAVADIIGSQIRPDDCAIRQGGEEFLIVMPRATIDDAAHCAERIRKIVASQLVPASKSRIAVTISIGIAAWTPDRAFEDMFKRADEALYLAKNNGRNRVEVWSDAAPWNERAASHQAAS